MLIHINPIYTLWHCGANGPTTTNDKDVTCPDCLARKPVDITQHPLTPYFELVAKEYNESKAKYGDWSEHDDIWQTDAVKSEMHEVQAAFLKRDGYKREKAELVQLSNVAGKRWTEIKRRVK